MLTTLMVRNLALIEELQIDFSDGVNMVTGETGAGKSVIIGAVLLLLGQRADRSLIRHGADSCEVNGIFDLAAGSEALASVDGVLAAAGIPPCEHGQLLVRRQFSEKQARVFVNSTPATLAVLKELGELLVDVHGPYDHQSLLQPARQLGVLDAFAESDEELAACRAAYEAWQEVLARIEAAENERPTPDLVELLRFQVKEIDQAHLREGEDEELTARHAKVAHASQIVETVGSCRGVISENEGALLDQLASVARELQELTRVDPEGARHLIDLVDSAHGELQNLADELAEYGEQVDVDPREFAELEARLAVVQRLKRKYGGSVERVLAHGATATERLARLEDLDAYREKLRQEAAAEERKVREIAAKLARRRREAAAKLAPAITRKLKRLGFAGATFEIELKPADPGPRGADVCEFFVAPNPGEGANPLRNVASSGEIARIMLALKTVLAAADRVPLLIFDEVDANIGGEVAVIVGEELRALGDEHQVICITHLPQIAAEGHRHFQVTKGVKGDRTVASMTCLDEEGRVLELARMLGGEGSSSVVRKHAKELLQRRKKRAKAS